MKNLFEKKAGYILHLDGSAESGDGAECIIRRQGNGKIWRLLAVFSNIENENYFNKILGMWWILLGICKMLLKMRFRTQEN